MGNQHAIRQTVPYCCRGAVLPVRAGGVAGWDFFEPDTYTAFISEGMAVSFSNLDGPATDFGVLAGAHVIVQCGGKMWCGYQAFVDHLISLAPYLEDATFYVADELEFIDRFVITAGKLHRMRVSSLPDLEAFLKCGE